MKDAIKTIYADDDIRLIREALQSYIKTVEETIKDFVGPDEECERNDLRLKAQYLHTLLTDFE